MIGNAILYIIIWVAVILVGYLLICGVAKVVKEDKPGEGSALGGCLAWIIIIGVIALLIYAFYALGGDNPSYNSPYRR